MAGSTRNDKRRVHEPDAEALTRRAALEQGEGNPEAAEALLREALVARENAAEPDDTAIIATLSALGQLFVARGAYPEAESVLTRALELTDATGGEHDSEQPLLLNELSRLYLKQAAYASAEPLLFRLLAIKQQQGEERPEVATVLASLATVKKTLGDHGAAEELYRHALRIREEMLPPNHITTAVTMESLAETCVARGHFAEAVSLSRRALSMREKTLGANDPSVRAARERIADLQLQAPEAIDAVPPLRSTPSSQRAQPENGGRLAPHTPRDSETQRPVAWAATEQSRSGAAQLPAVQAPWASELMAMQREIGSSAPEAVGTNAVMRTVIAAKLEDRSSRRVATVVVVTLLAALGLTSVLRRKPASPVFVEVRPASAGVQRLGATPVPTAPPVSQPIAEAGAPSTSHVAAAFAAAMAPRGASPNAEAREVERPQTPPASDRTAPLRGLGRAIIPTISLPDIDAGGIPTKTFTDSFPDRLPSGLGRGIGARSDGESDRAPTAPKLLGAPPQPRYPDRLRDLRIEGEVLVQFVVNEEGRADISSLQVVRSPHELMTNAVRAVLQQFRFEPARTAAPESRPRAETVKYGFTFHAPAR